MKKKYDIIVVGGGPTGSMAAFEAARAGNSVCVLEKTRDIGYPVRCGEAVGHSGLMQFTNPKKNWIASKIKSIQLVSPNKTSVDINFKKETGYILNRRVFDYDLSKMAVDAGAEVYTKAYVEDLVIIDGCVKGVKVNLLDENIEILSDIVIGADGIDSRIGRWGGLKTSVKMKDMESCVQYSVSNVNINQEQMRMYVGSEFAPGGYLWIFPKGDRSANIGIGISGKYSKEQSAKIYLDKFMKNNYPDASILTTVCGGVPCPKPMREPIGEGLMLAGDAAHQVNPMTGGGIISGMKGGAIAGIVASESIKSKDYSKNFLKKYPQRMLQDFGKNYERFYNIKLAVNQLNDDDLNKIAASILSTPLEKRTLGTVFKKAIFKKPSLVFDVLKLFSGF